MLTKAMGGFRGSVLLRMSKAAMSTVSQIRQNYHVEVETGINKQINAELHASYAYLSLAAFFDRDDVALKHVSKWFHDQSHEEREHAQKLIDYQNKRGGRVSLENVQKPEKDEWGTPLEAFQSALSLERQVNQSLIDLHLLAGHHNDPATADFLDGFLHEQVESISKIGKFVTNLKRVGTGLGEFVFDNEALS